MTDVPPGVLWPVAIIARRRHRRTHQGQHGARPREVRSHDRRARATRSSRTVETVGATGISLLAIAVPLLCARRAVVALLVWATRKAGRLLFGQRRAAAAARETDAIEPKRN